MAISIQCNKCGKTYKVKDESAGKRFKCNTCGSSIRVQQKSPSTKTVIGNDDFIGSLDEAVRDADNSVALTDMEFSSRTTSQSIKRRRSRSTHSKRSAWNLPLLIGSGVLTTLSVIIVIFLLFQGSEGGTSKPDVTSTNTTAETENKTVHNSKPKIPDADKEQKKERTTKPNAITSAMTDVPKGEKSAGTPSEPEPSGVIRNPFDNPFAIVQMSGMKPTTINNAKIPYKNLPSFINNGFVSLDGGNVTGNTTRFDVLSDGIVYLLLSGRPGGGGNSSGGWKDKIISPEELAKAGWESIAKIEVAKNEPFGLYKRLCHKGESFTYSWEKYIPPKLIIPAEKVSGFSAQVRQVSQVNSNPKKAGSSNIPGLVHIEYPRHTIQSAREGAFVEPSLLGTPISKATIIESVSPWTFTADRNAIAIGNLKIDKAGEYGFFSNSYYDRNALYIDGRKVCGYRDRKAIQKIRLKAGFVLFLSVGYYHSRGKNTVQWQPPGESQLSNLPLDRLFHTAELRMQCEMGTKLPEYVIAEVKKSKSKVEVVEKSPNKAGEERTTKPRRTESPSIVEKKKREGPTKVDEKNTEKSVVVPKRDRTQTVDLGPKIIQKLQALVKKKSSPRPLPVGSQDTPYQRLRVSEKSWNREQLVEAYKKHGRKNPKWDETVIKLLTQMSETFPGDPRASELLHLWKTAEKLVTESGCNDPLVRYFYARWLIHHGRRHYIPELRREGRRQLQVVMKDFPKTKYSRAIQSFATLFAVKIRVNEITYSSEGRNPSIKPHTLGKEFWRAFNKDFDLALKDPSYQKAGMPLFLDHLVYHLKREKADWKLWKAFVDRIMKDESIDLWLANMLAAEYEIAAAWDARGNQFANRLKPEEREGFLSHMLNARKHLLESWYLHPEYPHAATKMIQVTGGAGGIVGDSNRFWFDQAVAARFDHMSAYGYFTNFIQPQWGGSEQAMIEFGIECLNTKRFDTDVPNTMIQVVKMIVAARGAGNTIYQKKGIYQQLKTAYEGYAQKTEVEQIRRILQSELLANAWLAKRSDEVERLLAKLENRPDEEVLVLHRTSRRDLQKWLETFKPGSDARRFVGHRGQISKIAYSPDGKILASAGVEDMVVRLWDAKTGREIGTLQDYKERLWAIAFSPDGTKLAAGGMSRGIFIWDVKSRRRIQVLNAPGLIRCISFSPDGQLLVVSTGPTNSNISGLLQFWDVNAGKELGEGSPQDSVILDFAFSPDGKTLATTSTAYSDRNRKAQQGEVKFFDAESLQEIKKFTPFNGCALSITFSPDGNQLVLG